MLMESHNEIVQKLLFEYNNDLIQKNDIDSHAEVFDKHPITAMSDIDINNVDRVLIIADSWRPEWCKDGVQVPVNKLEEQKQPKITPCNYYENIKEIFTMPDKLIRSTKKHYFDPDKQIRVQESREILYEIDPIDCSWINVTNTERQCLGLPLITEEMIEVIFEMLESLSYKRIRTKIREAETEFLEHDENAKCDVCQSPEGEDGNELVFCEDCFICVHQACYGIPELPSGSWICRHCDKCPNKSSKCELCPNRGGAMKPVENEDDKWAHLSCSVWIPEVGFGNIDLMEPITRLNTIPQARWNLRCHICRTSNTGAPIQCSERKCKQAFHITCAIQNNLLMKQEFQTNNDVKLLAYCKLHTKKYVEPNSTENDTIQGPRDIIELRIQKQKELEQTFYKFATLEDLNNPLLEQCKHLMKSLRLIPNDIKEKTYTYWKLKRTSNHYLCLIKPPNVWSEEHQQQRLNNRSIMSAFCKIRFGLDRARLVVDMMVRREKKKANLFEVMSKISHLQLQQLKTSAVNPLLKDDPSLAQNWGMISTVHLDDNIYVNPGNLMDPNFEFVINNMPPIKTENENDTKSCNDFVMKMKQRLSVTKTDHSGRNTKMSQKMQQRAVAANQIVEKKELDATTRRSCVYDIPKEQLMVAKCDIERIFDKLQEPQFRCRYMLPLVTQLSCTTPVKGQDQVHVAAQLKHDSTNVLTLQNDVKEDHFYDRCHSRFDNDIPRTKIARKIPIIVAVDDDDDDNDNNGTWNNNEDDNMIPNRKCNGTGVQQVPRNLFEQFQQNM